MAVEAGQIWQNKHTPELEVRIVDVESNRIGNTTSVYEVVVYKHVDPDSKFMKSYIETGKRWRLSEFQEHWKQLEDNDDKVS